MEELLKKAEAMAFTDYTFNVRVNAARREDSFAFTNRYYRRVTYEVKYSVLSGGQRLYHDDDWNWYTDPGLKSPYGGTGTIDAGALRAEYDPKNIKTRQFVLEVLEDTTEGGTTP